MKPLRLLVIINPYASGIANMTAQGLAGQLETLLKDNPDVTDCEVLIPESPEELRAHAQERLTLGEIDRVIVAGGDGTIQETLPVLMKHPEIPLALLPMGTGNLLALNLDIPDDLAAALDIAVHGRVQNLDIGSINGSMFILNASIGIDAQIMKDTDRKIKQRLGKLAYFVTGLSLLPSYRHVRMKIVADGKVIHTRAVGVNIGNTSLRVPGGIRLAPDGSLDDGILHGTIFKARHLLDYLTGFFQLLISFRRSRLIRNFNARRIEIQSWPPLVTQADGNVIGETPAVIEVLPQKLKVCTPQASG